VGYERLGLIVACVQRNGVGGTSIHAVVAMFSAVVAAGTAAAAACCLFLLLVLAVALQAYTPEYAEKVKRQQQLALHR
jgi:acyl transferase domain-containing protein